MGRGTEGAAVAPGHPRGIQKATTRYLVEDKNADYLFTAVKDNQPAPVDMFVSSPALAHVVAGTGENLET